MASNTQNAPLSNHPYYLGASACKTRFYFQGQIMLTNASTGGRGDPRFHVYFGWQSLPMATFFSMKSALAFIDDELAFTDPRS